MSCTNCTCSDDAKSAATDEFVRNTPKSGQEPTKDARTASEGTPAPPPAPQPGDPDADRQCAWADYRNDYGVRTAARMLLDALREAGYSVTRDRDAQEARR